MKTKMTVDKSSTSVFDRFKREAQVGDLLKYKFTNATGLGTYDLLI